MEHNTDTLWPGWKTVRVIGHGGFGTVYEIQRDVMGNTERAALKALHIPKDKSVIEGLRDEGLDDASITQRFADHLHGIVGEYNLMASLKGHPNVVYCDDIHYIQHDDGFGWDIFIKMELLTPIMKLPQEHFDESQVIQLGIDICSALTMCREKNIVHRDIKPQNLFMTKANTYKLGDFGISKTMEHTDRGTLAGSYPFMAPEVYRMAPYGSSVDIYSLGMVLYWLLNHRRRPFLPLPPQVPKMQDEYNANMRRFDGEALPPPANGSAALKRIVLKACAFDPKMRYARAEDMKHDLEALLVDPNSTIIMHEDPDPPPRPKPDPQPDPPPRPQPDPPKPSGCGTFLVAAMLLAVLFGAYLFTDNTPIGKELVTQPAYEPNRTWEQNVLLFEPPADMEADLSKEPFFGTDLTREQILSVEFHTYFGEFPEEGTYDCWDVSEAQDGSVLLWAEKGHINYGGAFITSNSTYSVHIAAQDGIKVTDCTAMFKDCINLRVVEDHVNAFRTENVKSMASMYENCVKLIGFTVGTSTAQVTDMRKMFADCGNLSYLQEEFDTSQVTDMSEMFRGCSSVDSFNLSTWDTANVTNMESMFDGCLSAWNFDLTGDFDTSKVTNMHRMFADCQEMQSPNLSGWNTAKVIDMAEMFTGCGVYELDLSRWNTSSVKTMARMFQNCTRMHSLILRSWRNDRAEDMSAMFAGCTELHKLDISGFAVPKARQMEEMFLNCEALETLSLWAMKTPEAVDMHAIFSGCTALVSLDLSAFNTTKVTNMANMFQNCISLKQLNLGKWETNNVQTYEGFMDADANYKGKPWEEIFAEQ